MWERQACPIQECCWWKKSCTTWDVQNIVHNGINYQPQLVNYQPQLVSRIFSHQQHQRNEQEMVAVKSPYMIFYFDQWIIGENSPEFNMDTNNLAENSTYLEGQNPF